MSTLQPQIALTPEQIAQGETARALFIQRLKQGSANLKNKQKVAGHSPKKNLATIQNVTPNFLIEQANVIRSTGQPATFNVERDGISVNGDVHLDAEGTVERGGWDVLTGDFTYTTANIDGTKSLKFFRANSNSSPLTFASIEQQNGNYQVTTLDGKVMVGHNFIPTSNGVVVIRGASLFKYDIGEGVKNISIPRGWQVAHWQHGDVDSTNLVLIEKLAHTKQSNDKGFSGLLSRFNEIKRGLGMAEVFDYALLDIKTNQTYLLNMSLNDKKVTNLTNCNPLNNYVNKCTGSESYNSLYDSNGQKNRLHYYWALDWFNTRAGPMGLYNSGTEILVVDIGGNSALPLFQRTMGINSFDVDKFADGRITVNAKLGLGSEVISDLTSHLATSQIVSRQLKSI
jgi:hypothetical protein